MGAASWCRSLACAAALAVLDIYEKDNLIEKAAEMGQYLDEQAVRMQTQHPSIGDWRNTGILGCFEIVKNRKTKEPMCPWNGSSEVMTKVAAKIRELGMFTFVKWNFIFVAPPLCITKAQIDEGLAIISEAIQIADAAVQ